jgi:small-conductance mechanosensitive channel
VAEATAPVLQRATLKIANRAIVDLRGPIAGYSAAERVATTTERIEKILESDGDRTITLQDVEESKATQILLAGKLAILIVPIDVNAQSGETTRLVARETAKRLEIAVREWSEQRAPRYLALATASAVAATLLFAVLTWLVFRTKRWLGGRLSSAAAKHAKKLSVGGARLLDTSHVLTLTRRAFGTACWIIVFILASAWLTVVLELFPYTRPWGEGLTGNLVNVLKEVALAIAAAMPGLFLVVVIFFLARSVVRAAAVFFDRVASGKADIQWLDADTVRPTRRLFNFAVAVFAVAMAYPYLPGAGTEAFKGLSVLVGVMVSLGGASVVGQAFSGMILMYAKAFRNGDYVRFGEVEGTVVETTMFVTRLRTGMGEEITMPNSTIMAGTVKNYSRAVPGTGYIVDTVVTIGYSTPWRQVHAMLIEAARRTPDIVSHPPPSVWQTALSDFYPEYRIAAYTPVESPVRRIDVLSRLHANIQDVFNENGVQIMSPHYMADPQAPQVVPKDQLNPPLRGSS